MYKLINGKEVSQSIKDELKAKLPMLTHNKRLPKLVVIQVGNNQASTTYVNNKEKACNYIGIDSEIIRFDDITENDLIDEITKLNKDDTVDGILVQLPLPEAINEQNIIKAIDPKKDVDGFHYDNVAKLFIGDKSGYAPCTPAGIIELLKSINYDLTGKNVVIIGRSNIVGKPMLHLCLQENATVTIAHSKTQNLKEVCKNADVLIVAIGKAKFITKDFVKEGAVIIDVGINRNEEGKLCGDVDFEDVCELTSAITPVPGGVGPMTIAMLMKNTIKAYVQNTK